MYIRNVVPAEVAYLVHYYRDRGEQLVLASASLKGSSFLNLVAPMLPEASKFLEHPEIKTLITDRAEQHPIARPWIDRGLLNKDDSILTLRLFLQDEYVGAVSFFAHGSSRFSQEHADLVAPLREPFAIVLSNSL